MSLNNFTNFRNPSEYTVNSFNRNRNDGTNFNQAFNKATTLIPQRDTKNYSNALHNNFGDNIVNEMITEYTIHVDSMDRDLIAFPNPYQFVLSIGGAGSSTITQSNYINKNQQSVLNFTSVSYSGVPNPRIDVPFRNVKYIKLKYLMLPRTIVYDYDISGNSVIYSKISPPSSKTTILGNYRYLIMRIKEIANDNFYSTNDNIKNNCFILYRDSNYYDAISDLWMATQPIKIFYDDDLKNLSKMTIEIFIPPTPQQQLPNQPTSEQKSREKQIYYSSFGYPLPVETNLIFFTLLRQLNPNATPEPIPVAEVNGTNPNSDFYSQFGTDVQMSMEFEFGVCENQLNTNKNYR